MPVRPSTAKDSPNAALRDVLLKFFADGPHLAALRYRICTNAIKIPLQAIVRGGPLQAPPSLPKEADLHAIVSAQVHDHLFVQTLVDQLPWDDSKRAAEFVTLLCSDLEDLDSRVRAAAFNSRKLGGMPSMTQVRREPSADLSAALSKAIAVQRAGDAGRAVSGGLTVPSSSTCLVVLLVDTAALRSAELRPWSAPTGSTSIVTHTSSSAATAGTGAGAGTPPAASATMLSSNYSAPAYSKLLKRSRGPKTKKDDAIGNSTPADMMQSSNRPMAMYCKKGMHSDIAGARRLKGHRLRFSLGCHDDYKEGRAT
ncbi:hypothetical protein VOLCADRAFT_107809 [Volvox carteri f. nagariensis]|uniref:Uncharacterized protein n=1 Tax=Volvox carteri f. nagariensis TaxID=3068 RepID=D8UGL1_VOLCA|nr:uncharacterized protein VOLCADRAFT_107809 [Volvox carteri f. nagariensis]EFJ41117.1 hypothetical protein VOLCADRAFT_107809 [Volvox carteri f. nagariensis]|eukprot:XP_002957789.1 hypothetical protein VOLCADRAFT_107809 [Volvox carteri f. nagariensis]